MPAYNTIYASEAEMHGFFDFAAGITPLARSGTDGDVAKVIACLGSDDSSFVTGTELFVDGGLARV